MAVAARRAIPWTRWILFFGLAIAVLVVDQATKSVVVDQLAVLVWDAYAQGRGDGIPALLTGARRALG